MLDTEPDYRSEYKPLRQRGRSSEHLVQNIVLTINKPHKNIFTLRQLFQEVSITNPSATVVIIML